MSQNRWIITKGGGHSAEKSGRVGPGAVKKARETRERQLQRDLAKARRERLAQAVGGEFDVRAPGGEKVERLVAKASGIVEPGTAIICDPPVRRGSKQLLLDECEPREGYAKSVVCGPVVINGKKVSRDQDDGGRHGGNAVRKLN